MIAVLDLILRLAVWLLLAPLLPGILKTARLGYDGKGQATVSTVVDVAAAWAARAARRALGNDGVREYDERGTWTRPMDEAFAHGFSQVVGLANGQ